MCRHVYVYLYDCFMQVHACTYCICMYVMTMYSAVRIPLVSNFALYKLDLLLLLLVLVMRDMSCARGDLGVARVERPK